jgi:predicted transcriptional regulator
MMRNIPKPVLIILFFFFFIILILPSANGSGYSDLGVLPDDIYFSKLNPEPGEEVTIFAKITNGGVPGTSSVRFYEGYERNLIGEDKITLDEGASCLAKVNWIPSYTTYEIYISIENVNPYDPDLSNNEAQITGEFSLDPKVLEIEQEVATLEAGISRVIPIEVKAFYDLDNVDLSIIYKGEMEVNVLSPPQNMRAGETSKFLISITAPDLKEDEGREDRIILLKASNSDYQSNIARLSVSTHLSVEKSNWWNPTVAAAAGTLGIVTFIGSTEIGKYKLASFAIPFYTKLNKSEILDHYTRGKIHGYILANPGEHYNSIKKALELSNGSFAYHLRVLEREGIIKSKREGMYKRFYPYGAQIPHENGRRLTDTQKIIVERIRVIPGITQKEVAILLGINRSTVNYHINKLSESGIVYTERKGITVHYFLHPNSPYAVDSYQPCRSSIA